MGAAHLCVLQETCVVFHVLEHRSKAEIGNLGIVLLVKQDILGLRADATVSYFVCVGDWHQSVMVTASAREGHI